MSEASGADEREPDLGTITGLVMLVPEAYSWAPSAHITLLAPFGTDNDPTPGELADAERFFAELTPFEFTLASESRFPEGVRYLCPEPAHTFSRLTHRLHRLFPEYPPYEGRFDIVVPHLTVPDDAPELTWPLHVTATQATLLHHDESGFRALRTFRFGTSAA